MKRLLAVPVVLASVAVCAAPASAGGFRNACAKSAKVTDGKVVQLVGKTRDEQGNLVLDETSVPHPKRGPLYVAREAAELKFAGARYSLAADTIFDMTCAGYAGQTNLTGQSLNVHSGSATLHARNGHADGIGADEGAGYNFDHKAMTIRVTRVPAGDPTFDEIFQAGPRAIAFGTTTFSQSGSGYAAMTPYIGKERRTNGQCHYGKGGTLTSTGFTPEGFRKGSVRWSGLASFSPR